MTGTKNGSASKTRMAVAAASSPHTSALLGALITLGVIFNLHDVLGITVENFAIGVSALITVLATIGAWAKPWLARMTACVLLFVVSACTFTEGLAAASSTLRGMDDGFDRFAAVVRIEAKRVVINADKHRFMCEHKEPPVNIKKCMGMWWVVDRKFSPKLRRVVEKLPAGAALGPEALDAVAEGVELLAAIDGLRR